MKKLSTLGILILSAFFASAQIHQTDTIAKSSIKKLDFIVGQWSGQGWRMGQDGKKYFFDQTENVQFKLDSTILLIEGMGKNDGHIIHDALAVITSNKEKSHYDFRSQLSSGLGGLFKAELKEDKLYWYPNENIRYIIYLNDKGQWHEKGEVNRGGSWFQFFEMTLDKI